jgi:hypothetical protein
MRELDVTYYSPVMIVQYTIEFMNATGQSLQERGSSIYYFTLRV